MIRYAAFLAPALLLAQMDIRDYDPKSTLVVPQHNVTRAKFPFVDVHHHPRVQTPADVDQLVKDMDGINLRILVNLSGGWGERLQRNVVRLRGLERVVPDPAARDLERAGPLPAERLRLEDAPRLAPPRSAVVRAERAEARG